MQVRSSHPLVIFPLILWCLAGCLPAGGGSSSGQAGGGSSQAVLEDDDPYPGRTLFTPLGSGRVQLIDLDGQTAYTWDTGASGAFAKLQPDGTLLALVDARARPTTNPPPGGRTAIRELDPFANVLWEYRNPNLHHDMTKLPNGNVLAIVWEQLSATNYARLSPSPTGPVWSDAFIEIDHDSGQIVWEWHSQDELDLARYPFDPASNELTHANAIEHLPPGNPYNGVDSLLVSYRELDTIQIIDRQTGSIDWELGPGELEGQHNPTLLENGHILVFDNRPSLGASRIVEIEPWTDQILWSYEAPGLFSSFISGAQRLPGGTTLICEGDDGRLLEVARDGTVVWTYDNPSGTGIFRAHRYGAGDVDWSALGLTP